MTLLEVYHGTSVERAYRIEDSQEFERTQVRGRWLGFGTYFWIEDPVRALQHAMRLYPGRAAVVTTQIRPTNCLNLTTMKGATALRLGYRELKRRYDTEGKVLPKNSGEDHYLDCEVIEAFCSSRQTKYDSVKAFFLEGTPIYPGSALWLKAQIQIVVRDPRIIVGPSRVTDQALTER